MRSGVKNRRTSITFRPDRKTGIRILGKSAVLEEDLHEGPNICCSCFGSSDILSPVRKTNTNGLINVQHVGYVVP